MVIVCKVCLGNIHRLYVDGAYNYLVKTRELRYHPGSTHYECGVFKDMTMQNLTYHDGYIAWVLFI